MRWDTPDVRPEGVGTYPARLDVAYARARSGRPRRQPRIRRQAGLGPTPGRLLFRPDAPPAHARFATPAIKKSGSPALLLSPSSGRQTLRGGTTVMPLIQPCKAQASDGLVLADCGLEVGVVTGLDLVRGSTAPPACSAALEPVLSQTR
jgi:hypothetical protein